MPGVRTRYYWDTNVFLASITGEAGRAETCQRLWSDAESGKIQIVTSALTIAECAGADAVANMAEEELAALNQQIFAFFRNPCVRLIQADRIVGEQAYLIRQWCRRELNHRLPWFDAIHVASALRARATTIHTYDRNHLFLLDGTSPPGAAASLQVAHPTWQGTIPMPIDELDEAL